MDPTDCDKHYELADHFLREKCLACDKKDRLLLRLERERKSPREPYPALLSVLRYVLKYGRDIKRITLFSLFTMSSVIVAKRSAKHLGDTLEGIAHELKILSKHLKRFKTVVRQRDVG